jgi:DNA-binding NarL/FixJ family response regulator
VDLTVPLEAPGRTNKGIAAELGISPRTVETHRDSLAHKLGVRSVAELTRIAMEEGLRGGPGDAR